MGRHMDIPRILKNIAIAILMVIGGIIILESEEQGYLLVVLILSVSMIVTGIGYLVFFFTMSIHMVGGKTSLYIGALFMEFGLFTLTMYNVPKIYVLIYLAGTFAFSGVVDVLRALEAKNNLAPSWKLNLIFGIGNILVAVTCFVLMNQENIIMLVYAIGLFASAVMRVVRAFTRTTNVYIRE